ncbi:MAG: hypothetical protein AAF617_12460 [Bacteroidota bacterium]
MSANHPFEIELLLNDRPTSLSFVRNFTIHGDEIEIMQLPYRKIAQPRISKETYHDIIEIFKTVALQSVASADHYFQEQKAEVAPLLSTEFDKYGVDIDMISFDPDSNGKSAFMLEFDLFYECLDAHGNVIFMYDNRGCCCVKVQVSHTKELITTIDWDF